MNLLLEFKLWLEASLEQRKIRRMLLKRLGFDESAMDDTSVQTIKIKSYKNKIEKALASINLNADKLEELKNFIKNNPESSLQNLINQIDKNDFDDDLEDNLPGREATIPKGIDNEKQSTSDQQQSMPDQRNQNDAMMLGNPMKQGNMQVPY